ncbi:TcdA/TcdB catalytic glycosyltransferase domain-containing protein [Rouxiella sp. T17]|uniref:TcdA/TcdB catalytic glycosyltransferase domain-containing protein n=1 Tax=Rouxiella sp. T17 TaxID=3085684 RepID=UPI002FCBA02D
MKYRLSEVNLSYEGKVLTPNNLHFVWVGDTSLANTDYIGIWQKTNEDKNVYFWCDGCTSFVHLLHESVHKYIYSHNFSDKTHAEIYLKNKAFNYIFPKMKLGLTFNNLVIEFLEENAIPFEIYATKPINPWAKKSKINIMNIADLFTAEFTDFLKYYYYEIILRGNLASASDIVRLLIIYKHGGTYVDIDTLPSSDSIFKNLNNFVDSEKYEEDDYTLLYKTKKILKKLYLITFSDEEYFNFYKVKKGVKRSIHCKVVERINADMDKFSLNKILPLGDIYVHRNLLTIGAIKRLKGIYFNNFISSHSKSKAIKIILRSMKKRYTFLEKNNCIFEHYKGDNERNYLTRILTWRTELITRNYCVTPVLTGPGLIVEVLVSLAYALINHQDLPSPSAVTEYFHNDKFGIASFQHNLDTPEGVKSSWRK